jgi:hypothetical protein
MQSGTYIIFLGTGSLANQLCLGVKTAPNGKKSCTVATFDPASSATTWLLATVPGTDSESGLYLQHLDSQLCPHFGQSPILCDTLDPFNKEYFLRLDDLGDGQVAMNNHDRSYVMDANGDSPGVGANVTPWKWNNGGNQKWRFISTAQFTTLPG